MKRKIAIMLISVLTAVNLFSFSACGGEDLAQLKKENEALQQRLETLKQENGQAQTEKESLQNQFDDLNGQQQEILDEIKDLEDTIYGPPLESGFYEDFPKSPYVQWSGELLGIKSDRSRFDIDDVTLDFYFGERRIDSYEMEKYGDYFYDIYFTDGLQPYGPGYFVKHVEEIFYSKEYECEEISRTDIGDAIRRQYKIEKYQTLTVPKELFVGIAGRFNLELRFADFEAENGWNGSFFSMPLYYKVEYGKIKLSAKLFDEWKR